MSTDRWLKDIVQAFRGTQHNAYHCHCTKLEYCHLLHICSRRLGNGHFQPTQDSLQDWVAVPHAGMCLSIRRTRVGLHSIYHKWYLVNCFSFSSYSFLSRQEEDEEEARAPDPAGWLAASRVGAELLCPRQLNMPLKKRHKMFDIAPRVRTVLNIVKYSKYTLQIYVDVPTVTINKYAGTVHEATVPDT